MSSLLSLQRRFAAMLAGTRPADLDALIVAHGIPPAERAGIYRNNVQATFLSTMSVGFPATERLVGAGCFRALVDDYRGAHPSRSGNLQHVGADFSRFVSARFAATPYSYLAGVVALEWAYQEVVVAEEHAPLDLVRLAAVPPDDYVALRLRLHPAARLVGSPYPIARIWRANRSETLDGAPIDLEDGADRILLLRRGVDVEIHRLAAEDFAFLGGVAGGDTLERAFESAIGASPAADPVALLARYTRLGVIVDFRIDAVGVSTASATEVLRSPRAGATAP